MPQWRGGPNTRTLPTVPLTPPASKAADMAHLCVPQNQALGVCRGFVPDIPICGTHGREDLVNATIISNAEEEEEEEEKKNNLSNILMQILLFMKSVQHTSMHSQLTCEILSKVLFQLGGPLVSFPGLFFCYSLVHLPVG